jgi:hypothetical protein
MSGEPEAVKIARLEEKVTALTDMVRSLVDEVRAGNESRKILYERNEALRVDLIEIRHRIGHLQDGLDAVKPSAAEYVQVREQITGAGRLGMLAWRFGSVAMGAAGWLAAAYTYWTGKPPP